MLHSRSLCLVGVSFRNTLLCKDVKAPNGLRCVVNHNRALFVCKKYLWLGHFLWECHHTGGKLKKKKKEPHDVKRHISVNKIICKHNKISVNSQNICKQNICKQPCWLPTVYWTGLSCAVCYPVCYLILHVILYCVSYRITYKHYLHMLVLIGLCAYQSCSRPLNSR